MGTVTQIKDLDSSSNRRTVALERSLCLFHANDFRSLPACAGQPTGLTLPSAATQVVVGGSSRSAQKSLDFQGVLLLLYFSVPQQAFFLIVFYASIGRLQIRIKIKKLMDETAPVMV